MREGRPYAFHGPRADIDHVLLDHAAELGADVRQGWLVSGFSEEGKPGSGVIARRPDGGEGAFRRGSSSTRAVATRSPRAGRA